MERSGNLLRLGDPDAGGATSGMDLPAAQSRFRPDCGCDRGDGRGSGPLHGQRRAGDSAAGRLLRRLDNQLDCGSFQGNSWIHRLVKMTDALSALGAEKFVSLTTFKKDGTPVAAPMWIGRDGDHLFVWTPADSWKAKRAKNNPRVVLVPCSRGGKVREGAEPVDGIAEVITEPATVQRLAGVIRRKYGLEFIVVTFIERVVARGRKRRLILLIALTG